MRFRLTLKLGFRIGLKWRLRLRLRLRLRMGLRIGLGLRLRIRMRVERSNGVRWSYLSWYMNHIIWILFCENNSTSIADWLLTDWSSILNLLIYYGTIICLLIKSGSIYWDSLSVHWRTLTNNCTRWRRGFGRSIIEWGSEYLLFIRGLLRSNRSWRCLLWSSWLWWWSWLTEDSSLLCSRRYYLSFFFKFIIDNILIIRNRLPHMNLFFLTNIFL